MVKRTILARFTLFFLRNPYPELASIGNTTQTGDERVALLAERVRSSPVRECTFLSESWAT